MRWGDEGLPRKPWLSLEEHLFGPGPKRILSLDGGGVRGLITLGILQRIENELRSRVPDGLQDEFRLCHYFDLIGGTSTGALIATLLAIGYKVEDITRRYNDVLPQIFAEPKGWNKHWKKTKAAVFATAKFDADGLQKAIEGTLLNMPEYIQCKPRSLNDLTLSSQGNRI